MMVIDGIAIGGPAHGKVYDPKQFGPRMQVKAEDFISIRLFEYKLHYHYIGTVCHRYWLPADVQVHDAFAFLIGVALTAPASKEGY